jgi:hypothetical protein
MTDDSQQPSEDELRAAYEAEIKQIRIEQIVLENIVTLVNMGMRKTGLIPGTEDERDPDQVVVAIEGVRSQMPLVEVIAPEQAGQIKDALSQLQMAFVQIGGGPMPEPSTASPSPVGPIPQSAPPSPGPEPIRPGEPGPAQRSGKLWVPGQ